MIKVSRNSVLPLADAILISRQLQEKYIKKKQSYNHIFVDLEKVFDKILGKAFEWAWRIQLAPELIVQAVMNLKLNST